MAETDTPPPVAFQGRRVFPARRLQRLRRRFTAWLCTPYPEPRHRRHHRRPPNRPETHPANRRSYQP